MAGDRYRVIDMQREPTPPDATKTCPQCAEKIQAAALKCRYCGHKFPASQINGKQGLGCIIAVVVVFFLVWQCSNRNQGDNGPPKDYEVIAAGETGVKARLRDPGSAEFSGEHVGHLSGHSVLCGSVNSKNGFGGMTGAERFVAGGEVARLESELAPGEFEPVWASAC